MTINVNHLIFQLQAFVDDYKNCNLQIVLICEKICDTPLISIKPNYAYDVEELVNELASYMKNVIDKIVTYYQEIIQFLILVFEGFEQYMQSVGFDVTSRNSCDIVVVLISDGQSVDQVHKQF